jgi:TolB-like protein/tetratricopeptide (TPR) repeat protein/predicted Ser/Thr protein kinase
MLGHYRLGDKIGEGGMGVVYRARDERLERDVAVKVLPAGMLSDESARRRLRKEALALSKLNHPNVATVHDFDSDSDIDFLVEEFIEGASLDEMAASRPFAEDQSIDLGTQLAEGLAAAHASGVLHRDLKPGNVRVTPEGRLKILDFGIATVLRDDSGTNAATTTETHGVRGTLPYMAPEQLTGGKIDQRTDIWGAGSILYEMATGRRPFHGQGAPLIDAILHQRPQKPSHLNRAISPGFEAIILKCLETDLESRYGSAKELSSDLLRLQAGIAANALKTRRVRAVATWAGVAAIGLGVALGAWQFLAARIVTAPIRSVAVLPFENLSGDPQQEYFADGMTETLIANLGRLTALDKVSARTSVMRYKTHSKSPAEIARELKVDALITGSVQRSGSRVRLNAHLINPSTGHQTWTETYEREEKDVLRLQDELTSDIARQIHVKLTAAKRANSEAVRGVDPEAYEAYLMGRHHMFEFTAAALARAEEYFEIAMEKDPGYSDATIGFALVWGLRGHLGFVPLREGWARAEPFILKVLATNPSSAEAHQQLASKLAWCDWQWDGALREYERAIALNPNDPVARFFYSLTLFAMRRPNEAQAQMERAIEIDPFNPTFHEYLAFELASNVLDRPDEALRQLERLASIDPTSPRINFHRWLIFERRGQYREAIGQAREFFSSGPSRWSEQRRPAVAAALESGFAGGDYGRAMVRAAETIELDPNPNPQDLILISQLYAAAGQDERAINSLYRAYDRKAGPLPYVNAWARFEHMRSNPRFKELLRRMNLQPAERP